MRSAYRSYWSRLAACLLMVAGMAQHTAAQESSLRIELAAEQTTYQAPDVMRLCVTIANKSKAGVTLTALNGGLLDVGVYIGNGRAFMVPAQNSPGPQLALAPGQEKVFKYEIPTRRVVVYSPYDPPEGKVSLSVQGPWFKEINAPQRADLTLKLQGAAATRPTKPPASQPTDPLAVALSQRVQRAEPAMNGVQLLSMTAEECRSLAAIDAVKKFVAAETEFDGVVYDHAFGLYRHPYGERIIVLGSQGARVKTLVVRTWGHLQGDKASRVLESLDAVGWHRWRRHPKGTPRYSIEVKDNRQRKEPPSIVINDARLGAIVFEASLEAQNVGLMIVPRQQEPIEINRLSEEQVEYLTSLNRSIVIKWSDSQRELEEAIAAMGFRLHPNPYEGKVRNAAITIPPDADRTKAIETLKKDRRIKVFDPNASHSWYMAEE